MKYFQDHKVRSCAIIVVVLSVIGGLFLLPARSQSSQAVRDTPNSLTANDGTVATDEASFPTRADTDRLINKSCPFYQPNGVEYRDCLANMLNKTDQIAQDATTALVRDTKAAIALDKVKNDDPGSWASKEDFLTNVVALQSAWKPYRDALCNAELSTAWGGSDQSGMITRCLIYEDELYWARMMAFRNDWLDQN